MTQDKGLEPRRRGTEAPKCGRLGPLFVDGVEDVDGGAEGLFAGGHQNISADAVNHMQVVGNMNGFNFLCLCGKGASECNQDSEEFHYLTRYS